MAQWKSSKPVRKGKATQANAQTPPGPTTTSWISFESKWQREYARRCQELELPLTVLPTDRVGWLYVAVAEGAD